MKPEDFIKAGYREHKSKSYETLKMTDTLLQKRIDDEIGKKFFIDVWVYDNKYYKETGKFPKDSPDFSFQPEVQFYSKEDEPMFNCMCFMGDKQSVEDVEEFFAELWAKMNLGYYERFES